MNLIHDYTTDIISCLKAFSGIVGDPDRVLLLNARLNEFDSAGFGKLTQNLLSQQGSDEPLSFLTELAVCRALMNDSDITDLCYEPDIQGKKPDFRFAKSGINFDIQVKRVRNTINEVTREKLCRELDRSLHSVKRAVLLSIWVSDDFPLCRINDCTRDLQKASSLLPALREYSSTPQYQWPESGTPLLQYCLYDAKPQMPYAATGFVQLGALNGMPQQMDVPAQRKAVERVLKRSSESMPTLPSPEQCNVVIIDPGGTDWLDVRSMQYVLSGVPSVKLWTDDNGNQHTTHELTPDGTFIRNKYRHISYVILLPRSYDFLAERIKGTAFSNPQYRNMLQVDKHLLSTVACRLDTG
jgi:hypothetical protein